MGFKIVFSPQAIVDLEEVVSHIAHDDREIAERIGNELIDRVEILSGFPFLGSVYRKRKNIRKLISKPYLIFYRVDSQNNRIDILRYWHGKRQDLETV